MTMTLEQVRDWLEPRYKNQPDDIYDAVEAAIRERDELLRLAEDAVMFAHAVSLGQRYKQRAETAEAELVALKVRIAEAPVAYLTSKTGVGPCNVASMAHGVVFDSSSYGKSVRVVLDE